MNRFLQLLGAAALLSSALTSPASATTHEAHVIASHVRLAAVVESKGVDFVINPPMCYDTPGISGFYSGSLLAVCTTTPDALSADDLDTIRHEAHHMVQDCLGDGKPDYVFNGRSTVYPDVLTSAVELGLDEGKVAMIYSWYGDLEERDILMEVEAFAVAHGVDADTIADAVDKLCAAR